MKKTASWVAAIILSTSVLTGCGEAIQPQDTGRDDSQEQYDVETNTNPRDYWVTVWEDEDLYKRCDGTTLVYITYNGYGDAFNVIPNSPECVPN